MEPVDMHTNSLLILLLQDTIAYFKFVLGKYPVITKLICRKFSSFVIHVLHSYKYFIYSSPTI